MPFGIFKKFTGNLTNKLAGRTDLLEAVCAGAALVAYADGDADHNELKAATKAVAANASLSAAFNPSQIERTMETMLGRAEGGRMGRAGLYKELEDVASNAEDAEIVIFAVLDVADSGGISDAEQAEAGKIARTLGLDIKNFL